MKLLRHLPNTLTSGNLLCGCLGIVSSLQGSADRAIWFVIAACVFDFFDGFSARALHVSSPIGKELDSLADMVSFGVLPSLVMYRMIDTLTASEYLPYLAFLLAAFSALRLAKFNVDESQTDTFRGLPTPANALFISSLVYLRSPWDTFISQDYFLVVITLVFSFLLVAPFELFALKFKTYSWKDNRLKFTFLAFTVLLIALWQLAAMPFVILTYVAVSLVKGWFSI
ncbi:MAG: CDP-diacylglycerol--serine O-phosphatidyltransferase [Cyclobacteriaceae bacterium]|nr:CDP-diacylglycerol--serine O-phosphatidyltransferase [Cyclobacteriaceae bacterium]